MILSKMTLAIPLYFDPLTEAAIQAVWQELAKQKIAPFMASSGIRPHLTLAIYRDINRYSCQALLSPLIERLNPLPVSFTYLGIFPSPAPVVFLAPTVTRDLLALHAEVNRLLDEAGDTPDPFYLPDHWVPHCTLAVEFDAALISPAVEIARKMILPLKGWASELCLVEFPPMQHVFRLPMKPLQKGQT